MRGAGKGGGESVDTIKQKEKRKQELYSRVERTAVETGEEQQPWDDVGGEGRVMAVEEGNNSDDGENVHTHAHTHTQ